MRVWCRSTPSHDPTGMAPCVRDLGPSHQGVRGLSPHAALRIAGNSTVRTQKPTFNLVQQRQLVLNAVHLKIGSSVWGSSKFVWLRKGWERGLNIHRHPDRDMALPVGLPLPVHGKIRIVGIPGTYLVRAVILCIVQYGFPNVQRQRWTGRPSIHSFQSCSQVMSRSIRRSTRCGQSQVPTIQCRDYPHPAATVPRAHGRLAGQSGAAPPVQAQKRVRMHEANSSRSRQSMVRIQATDWSLIRAHTRAFRSRREWKPA